MFLLKKMKIFILVLSLIFPNFLLSDELENIEPTKNVLYFEFAGVGIFYSINYERFIEDDYSIRIGYSQWAFGFIDYLSFEGIPLMVNHFIGDGNHKLELGLGLEYVKTTSHETELFTNEVATDEKKTELFVISAIGYRYQPTDGGFHFRIGLSPMIDSSGFTQNLFFSFGVCF